MIFFPFLIFGIIVYGILFSILPFLSIFRKQLMLSAYARFLLSICRVKVEVDGQFSDDNQKLIIVANHSSFLDTFILLAKLPFPFYMTVYPLGFRIPFLRRVYKAAGYIGVGKGSNLALSSYGLYKVLSQQAKVVIYSAPVMKQEREFEFSPEIIKLSKLTDTLILPIAIKNCSKALPFNKFRLKNREKIRINIGTPQKFVSPQELRQAILSLY